MSALKDRIKQQAQVQSKQNRKNRVERSVKKSSTKNKPSKSDYKYIEGNIAGSANGKHYGIKKYGDGDFSYYKKNYEAGHQKLSNYEKQQNGENPYEIKYKRTSGLKTVKGGTDKNGNKYNSFKTYNEKLTKKEQENYKKYGTLTKPDSKLKKVAKGALNTGLNALDVIGTPGYLITGATKGVIDGFNGDGKLNKGELKNAIKGAKDNVALAWKNKGNHKGEGKFGFGDIFDSVDALEDRKKTNDPNYESKKIYRASTGNGFDRDKLSDKTKKTLNTIGGMGLDMALPMEISLPLGTLVKGTGKSFTNVAKKIDTGDVAKVVDKMVGGQKVDDIAREVAIHNITRKANKFAGNIDPNQMEGVKLLGKELLNGEQVAKIGDATGISRAYNQIRHFMQQGQRNKTVEDIATNVMKDRFSNSVNLLRPTTRTPLNMEKEQYDLAMGFTPDWKLRKEAKNLDNRFVDKVGENIPSEKPNWMLNEDEINDIQIGKPNIELDGKSIDEFIKRTNGIERYTDTFDATNVSEITPLTTHSDINKTPGRFKIASKPKSNEKKITEIEKDLGMSIDEFITHMDKDAQDYALSKLPQYKADFLLDEIDKRNPKVNEIFDDFGSESFDMNVENTVPSIKNTPNINSAEKEKEKQAIDALMKIFEKKYNTGHTANHVLPHKQRQDMYASKMGDLFSSKTPIDENVEKQVINMVDYINHLGKKKLTEQDKDKMAKTLNVVLFENKPVIRNNMGDKDFRDFINLINDGISDQKSGVPDMLNRGLKDYKMFINSVTDPNSDLKRKYLARKYGYETKFELEREIKELKALAKKDPSKFGEFKKKEQILQARNDEHIKIRDLGENEWNDYYSKWRNKGKNSLDGYYETIEEVSEQMRKEMDAKLERAEEIKNSNIGKALEVKEVKGKQYYDNLKNTRKELGLKYTEFRKDKITPIPQKAHDNLPMVNINIGNKTKQVKDYNRLESVRSSKLNLKKLIEAREQMRFATTKDARNLQNIPSYDPRIINDMIKQELNYLDTIGVPKDTYVESMQMYVASYKKSLEQQFGHLPTNDPLTKTKNKFKSKKENDYYLEKIKKTDDISDVLDSDIEVPLKMNLQMCARQFVGEEIEELPGISNKVLQANNDSLVSMFDEVRQVLLNRKGFEETPTQVNTRLPKKDWDLYNAVHNPSFAEKETLTDYDMLKNINEFLGGDYLDFEDINPTGKFKTKDGRVVNVKRDIETPKEASIKNDDRPSQYKPYKKPRNNEDRYYANPETGEKINQPLLKIDKKTKEKLINKIKEKPTSVKEPNLSKNIESESFGDFERYMQNTNEPSSEFKPKEPTLEELNEITKSVNKFMGVEEKLPEGELSMPERPTTEQIDRMVRKENMKKLSPLSIYDGLLKDFKANVTVNNLGWHAGNFVQNKLLNAQDIGIRSFFPRTDALDVYRGKSGEIVNEATGEIMDYDKFRRYLEEGGLTDNFINKEVQSSSEGNPLSKLFHNVLRPSGKNSIGSGFGILQKNPDETLAKIQNVMAHMEDGDDVLTAMDKAQKTLFDYDDLSNKEKNIAKRIIPFYAYAKKNTANQLGYLANDQRTHSKLLNAYRNINEKIPYGEEREIKDYEENYLNGRIQIPGMYKEHEGQRYDYMLNPKLPFNPIDSADGMRNLSPLLNPLVDIAKNENFFGEEIENPVKYYLDEIKRSYTHPVLKSKERIDKYKEDGKDFKIPPEILKILVGISGNYY